MRDMKDSGIEWVGKIPKDWMLTQVRRQFNSVKRIVGDSADEYERLALTLKGVIKRSKDDNEGLQPEKFEGYQILKENELVFKMIDLENANTSRVGLSPYTGLVSPAYIVLSSTSTDNRYAYYWFMFMYYYRIYNKLGGDGVRSAINVKDMLSLPIPNLTVLQKRVISDYLDCKCSTIDTIIAKQEQIVEKLKEYKLSLITEAVTKGLNANALMMDSGDAYIGDIPTGWILTKLKHLSLEIGDGLHGTPNYDSDGEYYFLNGQNIGEDKLVFNDKTDRLNKDEFSKYKPTKLTNNTILITLNGATYGKTSFYNGEKVFLGKSAGYITLKQTVNKYYVRYYLQSLVAKTLMDLSLCGSTIANLSLGTLNDFSIPFPSVTEQECIVRYLNTKVKSINEAVNRMVSLIERLQAYKKAIIYEVVTGKQEV